MKKNKQKYQPGDLVLIPLEGGFGSALVYRWDENHRRGSREILVLGLDRISQQPFVIEDVENSKPEDFSTLRFQGDACIHHGDWPVLGRLKSFSYESWPTPVFRLINCFARWRDDFSSYDIPAECISQNELLLLPPRLGLGTARAIEVDIEMVVRSRDARKYFPLSQKHFETWREITERARRMGIE